MAEEKKFYTIRQVANITGAKVRTVREWIRLGKLKGEKNPISGRWFFDDDEVSRIAEVYKK